MVDNLADILSKHKRWLLGYDDGVRADLRGADLSGADLREADLRGADLTGELNLHAVVWDSRTVFYPLQCPETGSFIGWKKCGNHIVKLKVCEDALRSSATSRKCRCSKAEVLAIESLNGEPAGIDFIVSNYDKNFIYRIGETVEVTDFDNNRWNECSTGIHFFITREEAVKYQ